MNSIFYMVISFCTGIGLGVFFFGGLWWTVKKMARSKMPAVWLFSSFIIRVGVTLLGIYLVAAGDWQKMILCLIGFVTARFMVIHFTKQYDEKQIQFKKEVSHET